MFTLIAGIRRHKHVNCHWVLAKTDCGWSVCDRKLLANWFFRLIQCKRGCRDSAAVSTGPRRWLLTGRKMNLSGHCSTVKCRCFVGCLSLIFRAGLGLMKAACVEGTASRGQWTSVWDSQLGCENQKHRKRTISEQKTRNRNWEFIYHALPSFIFNPPQSVLQTPCRAPPPADTPLLSRDSLLAHCSHRFCTLALYQAFKLLSGIDCFVLSQQNLVIWRSMEHFLQVKLVNHHRTCFYMNTHTLRQIQTSCYVFVIHSDFNCAWTMTGTWQPAEVKII